MRGFLLLVIAGLGSAALGCGLGWLIGSMSPEFIDLITYPRSVAQPERLGAALGLVSGLFLGIVAMAFGLVIEAILAWAARLKPVKETPSRTSQPADHTSTSPKDFSIRPA